MSVVAVEASAKVLRGLAVPYDRPALVAEPRPDGGFDIAREVFDADSLILPTADVPLLVHHDVTRPIGRIGRMWHGDEGLEVEGELIGGAAALDHQRELIGAGLQSSLSIAFFANDRLDIWTRGKTPGEPPLVRRRGARPREISLVIRGAYPDARVRGVSNRTERQVQWRRERDAERRQAERAAAERHARVQAYLAELDVDLALSNRRHKAWLARRATQAPPAPPPVPELPDPLTAPPYNLAPLPSRPDLLADDREHERYRAALEDWLADVARVNRRLEVELTLVGH